MTLPTDDKERKALPVFTGPLMYFPDAIAEIARVCKIGNDKHNPGEPMHWARDKSTDQLNTALRHMMDHGTGNVRDKDDGCYHIAKAAWRLLAELQLQIEKDRAPRAVKETCAACGHAKVFHRIGTGAGVPVGQMYCDDRHDEPCSCRKFTAIKPESTAIKPESVPFHRTGVTDYGKTLIDVGDKVRVISGSLGGREGYVVDTTATSVSVRLTRTVVQFNYDQLLKLIDPPVSVLDGRPDTFTIKDLRTGARVMAIAPSGYKTEGTIASKRERVFGIEYRVEFGTGSGSGWYSAFHLENVK